MTSRRHLSGRERPDHRTVFSGKSFAERLSWHHVMRLDPRLRNSTSGFSSPPLPRIGRTSDPVRRSRGVQQFFRPGARLPLPSFQCLSLTRGLDFSNTALDLGSSTCITVLDSFLHQSRCPQGENLLPSPSAAKSAPKRLTSSSDQHRGTVPPRSSRKSFFFGLLRPRLWARLPAFIVPRPEPFSFIDVLLLLVLSHRPVGGPAINASLSSTYFFPARGNLNSALPALRPMRLGPRSVL